MQLANEGNIIIAIYNNQYKTIPIRIIEECRVRQVIGLDRFTFTVLGKIVYKKIQYTYTPQSINYINNYIVYCYSAMI